MSSKLESLMGSAIDEFQRRSILEISPGIHYAKGKSKPVSVSTEQIVSALKQISPSGQQRRVSIDLVSHFEQLEKLIPLCSSPKSFRSAWDLRSNILNKYDADTLVNEGAQLIPNNKNLRLFQAIQQGVELDLSKRFVAFVRHVEGNYDDELDDLGRFTYQPPADCRGMLRYRWCQFLGHKLRVPIVVIAVMWFRYKINKASNLIFVSCPAQIIDCDKDLQDFGKSLSNPLTLQLITRARTYEIVNLIREQKQAFQDIDIRTELKESLAREWSFDRINATQKGKNIKKWAMKMGLECPGNRCHHIKFARVAMNQMAFGHVISQRWARSFSYLLSNKDHPDNLYLTCMNCNSELGDNFPETQLRAEIERRGTIGDWLRKDERGIRGISI